MRAASLQWIVTSVAAPELREAAAKQISRALRVLVLGGSGGLSK